MGVHNCIHGSDTKNLVVVLGEEGILHIFPEHKLGLGEEQEKMKNSNSELFLRRV